MSATAQIQKFGKQLRNERAKFVALALFFTLAFLLGGGARDDIQSLVLLRPLSILFVAYALTVAANGALAQVRVPLYLLLALLVLISLQLVPLPPAVWRSLPGREFYGAISDAVGFGDLWRPLSLSPSKTLNSLFSLAVPLAAIGLVGIQSDRYRRKTIILIAALLSASSIWGLSQSVGTANGPLYLYRITNGGLPVGLFANRNHQAAMLAAGLPIIAYIAATAAPESRQGIVERVTGGLLIMLFMATILMTGSRAGLICMAMGLVAAAAVSYVAWGQSRSSAPPSKRLSKEVIALLSAILLTSVTAIVVIWFGQALAIERMLSSDEISNLRGDLVPTLIEMAKTFFPAGSGFGSFEHVYYAFEPTALLRSQYLNQAHNDWLQLVIEGGALAVLLLGCFVIWLGRQARLTFRMSSQSSGTTVPLRMAAMSVIVILATASIFDYPLRVPSIMAVFAASCALLAATAKARRTDLSHRTGDSRGDSLETAVYACSKLG